MKQVEGNHINVSDTIMHPTWGVGVVTDILDNGQKKILQVLFENSFYKILWEFAVGQNCKLLPVAIMEG